MWRKIFTGRERRQYVRLSTGLNVDFKLDSEGSEVPLHKGVTRDISSEGICLAADVSAKEKSRIHLYIYFPSHPPLDVDANVIWQHQHLLGLRFTKIEKDSQEIIRSFIANNLFKKYRPV